MILENNKPCLVYHEYNIDQQPWPEYKTDIEARARLAYSSGCLYLEFLVTESFVQAEYRNANAEVHKDSCTEFFVRFDDDENYYNIEFNALGNIKLAYGRDRNNRTKTGEAIINKIKRKIFFKPRNKDGQLMIEWRLTATIPASVFHYHNLERLEDHQIFGNFYKCGDDYDQPHYLSWSAVRSEHPDFHRPDCFRLLLFNKKIEKLPSKL